jgi:hypothetical protein
MGTATAPTPPAVSARYLSTSPEEVARIAARLRGECKAAGGVRCSHCSDRTCHVRTASAALSAASAS